MKFVFSLSHIFLVKTESLLKLFFFFWYYLWWWIALAGDTIPSVCWILKDFLKMLTSSGNMQQPPNYYYDPRLLSDPRQNFHHENYYRYPSGFTHHPVLPDYVNHSVSSASCTCNRPPVQETFLHQILMGKGYKNDCLYVNRPMKPESYHDYTCCYSRNPYYPPYSYSNH